ncbi:MAG: hypothetical protein H5U36_06715 [Candidatus Caldatribacterium sp.]|nr:hypothetical protein [Candidatus Caldatribacterium sp.]
MDSRTRVYKALKHNEPDRIPLDFEAREEVVQGLIGILGLRNREDLLSYFGIDFRQGGLLPGGEFLRRGAFFHPRRKWVIEVSPGIYEDEFGIRYRTDDKGRYFGFIAHPLARDEDLSRFSFPDFEEEERYDALKKVVALFKSRFFIQGEATSTLFELAWQISGYEHFLYKLYRDPAWAEKLLDEILALRLVQCTRYVEIGVDIVYLGDDFGMQDRMMVSPELWRKYFKPRMRTLIETCKKANPSVFIQYHSDGYIEPIIPDLIEIGVDILNPVQPECMDVEKIKRCYGKVLTLHGTISVQSLLPFSSREQLKEELTRIVTICAPGGGYIAAPTHAIQTDVPLENIIFMYEFLKRWRYEQKDGMV